jgi:hypothetical protein
MGLCVCLSVRSTLFLEGSKLADMALSSIVSQNRGPEMEVAGKMTSDHDDDQASSMMIEGATAWYF